jgi:hypothetical protein
MDNKMILTVESVARHVVEARHVSQAAANVLQTAYFRMVSVLHVQKAKWFKMANV